MHARKQTIERLKALSRYTFGYIETSGTGKNRRIAVTCGGKLVQDVHLREQVRSLQVSREHWSEERACALRGSCARSHGWRAAPAAIAAKPSRDSLNGNSFGIALYKLMVQLIPGTQYMRSNGQASFARRIKLV